MRPDDIKLSGETEGARATDAESAATRCQTTLQRAMLEPDKRNPGEDTESQTE